MIDSMYLSKYNNLRTSFPQREIASKSIQMNNYFLKKEICMNSIGLEHLVFYNV